jgi:hypothetical protein
LRTPTLRSANCAIITRLQPLPGKKPRKAARGGDPHEAHLAIERFLAASRKPVLIEPGEDPFVVAPESFVATLRGSSVSIECWDQTRNLVRRVTRLKLQRTGRLELEVERFGGRKGVLILADLTRLSNRETVRRGERLKYRERFRQSLHRQFPDWRIVELSTEADLEHSLSPSFPRALLRKGTKAIAAIGAGEDALMIDGVLSFGLIWLDYVRHRETKLAVEALAIFLPAGAEQTTCHRVRYLDPSAAQYFVFVHDSSGREDRVDPRDYTNFETHLDVFRQPFGGTDARILEWARRIASIDGVERRDRPDGSVSFAVNGLEFARVRGNQIHFGLEKSYLASTEAHLLEIERLAVGLTRLRSPEAARHHSALTSGHSEAWLESRIRANIHAIDATLLASPLYGQVPQFAGAERGVVDLLAADYTGRLAIIEVKAFQDIHLPLQALDYWMRVKWHLERGEFAGRGYFPGIQLLPEPPRLLLVAPALEWHPSNKAVLRFFASHVPVERLGIGIEWKRELKVMFRVS